jgi:hypothetical protein
MLVANFQPNRGGEVAHGWRKLGCFVLLSKNGSGRADTEQATGPQILALAIKYVERPPEAHAGYHRANVRRARSDASVPGEDSSTGNVMGGRKAWVAC